MLVFDPREITFESKLNSSSNTPGTYIGISLKSVGVEARMTCFAPDSTCPVSYTHLTLPTTPYV